MRAFKIIKKEIENQERTVAALQMSKSKLRYVTDSGAVGAGIRALLWGAVAAVFAFLHVRIAAPLSLTVYLAGAALFMLLALIAAIKYFKRSIKPSGALVMLIISGIILAYAALDMLQNREAESFIGQLLASKQAGIEARLEMPMATINRYLFYANFALLCSSALILIGSVCKYISQLKKKSDYLRKTQEADDQIKSAETMLEALKTELAETTEEATRAFEAEAAKETPDADRMKELADLGLEQAAAWLEDKKAEEDRLEGERICEEEMGKERPDKKNLAKAAELGCAEAGFWLAKTTAVSCIAEMNDYADREIKIVFTQVGDYAKQAEGCRDEDMLLVIRTLAGLLDGESNEPSHDDITKASQILRDLKKSEALSEEDKILTERALPLLISANDQERKGKSNERQNVEDWDAEYVRKNTLFCVTWCDVRTEMIVEQLRSHEYRKAKDKILDVIGGLSHLDRILSAPQLDFIQCVTYFMAGVLDICKGDEWYNESARRDLATEACRIAGRYDFTNGELANKMADMLSNGASFADLKTIVFPKFPKEVIDKLEPLREPYEELWNDVKNGSAYK